MKSVKWIRNGAGVGYGYVCNDTCELTDAEAIALRNTGHVLIIPDTIDAVAPVHTAVITSTNTRKNIVNAITRNNTRHR